ncbi:MAG: histidinol-phosphate transaminase [Lachnospiraceae bacterium]|nr:histidinol-phosphate transaminase [Lachnospiraceae bacterium]
MCLWEENVRKVTPYTPGEQPAGKRNIKLNTNENPYPPAPGVEQALKNIDADLLRRYPDPNGEPLRSAIAGLCGVSKEKIFLGVGSDEVLALAFLTFFNGEKPILFPDITYSFYDVWAELYGIPYERIPLDPDFRIRKEDYCKPCGGIVLANPNAPTGVELAQEELEEIIEAHKDVVVIVDEAYVDFGARSVQPLLDKYDQLLIVRTFSKSRSLAGMRLGYAIGNEKLIKYLSDIKFSFNSYTINRATILAGVEACRDQEYFEKTVDRIIRERERTGERLQNLGFEFFKSKTNFLFVTHPSLPITELFDYLRERGIFVRHFQKPERIVPYLRITIGTEEEMDELIKAIETFAGEHRA